MSKQFSRLQIDLTLEESINNEASCQKIGISAIVSFSKTKLGSSLCHYSLKGA